MLLALIQDNTSGCFSCTFIACVYDIVGLHVMVQHTYLIPVYGCTLPGYILTADWSCEGCLWLITIYMYLKLCTPWWMHMQTNIKYTKYMQALISQEFFPGLAILEGTGDGSLNFLPSLPVFHSLNSLSTSPPCSLFVGVNFSFSLLL